MSEGTFGSEAACRAWAETIDGDEEHKTPATVAELIDGAKLATAPETVVAIGMAVSYIGNNSEQGACLFASPEAVAMFVKLSHVATTDDAAEWWAIAVFNIGAASPSARDILTLFGTFGAIYDVEISAVGEAGGQQRVHGVP